MNFPLDIAVAIVGFTFALWWAPTQLQLMPALLALIFSLYPLEASFTGFVSVLLFGVVSRLFKIGV